MGKTKSKCSNSEQIVAGQKYTITASTRKEAGEKMRKLQREAFSEGLLKSEGGMICYVREDYLDAGKFVGTIVFNL